VASRGSGEGQGSLTGLRRGSGNSNEGCRASARVKEALRGFGEGQESLAGLREGQGRTAERKTRVMEVVEREGREEDDVIIICSDTMLANKLKSIIIL